MHGVTDHGRATGGRIRPVHCLEIMAERQGQCYRFCLSSRWLHFPSV